MDRLNEVRQLTDARTLAEIAAGVEPDDVRNAAIVNPHLNDPTLFARIVANDREKEDVRLAAVKRLDDQPLLKDLVLGARIPERIRRAALTRLTDQDLLVEVALNQSAVLTQEAAEAAKRISEPSAIARVVRDIWERRVHWNYDLLRAAVANASFQDEELLSAIARSPYAQNGLVARIQDPQRLADIAENACERAIKRQAAARLPEGHEIRDAVFANAADVGESSDQSRLWRIARHGTSEDARHAAIERLTDQDKLLDLAERGRPEAIARLRGSEDLARIAKCGKTEEARRSASANPHLTDQEVLVELARHDDSPKVRNAAIVNPSLANEEILAEVAKTDPNPDVRRAALTRLSRPSLVKEVATRAADPQMRISALRKEGAIDQHDLARIAEQDPDESVRLAAVEQLQPMNQDTLVRIVRGDKAASVREAAVNKLNDAAVLARVASCDASQSVRSAAKTRLANARLAHLRVESLRSSQVGEVIDYLQSLEDAYNRLCAGTLLMSGVQLQAGASTLRDALPSPLRLHLVAVRMSSPGSWLFGGLAEPFEVLRKYLADRHERRKDRQYREELEADRLRAETQRVRTEDEYRRAETKRVEAETQKVTTENLQSQLELMRQSIQVMMDMGFTEQEIRAALQASAASQLGRLGHMQDLGFLGGAFVEPE